MNLKNMLTLGLAGALVLTGCRKDFDSINPNHNEPLTVSTGFLLTSAQKSLMDNTTDEWWNGRRGNQLAQYWASNQYSNESRYQFRTEIDNEYWSAFYAGALKDLQDIIDLNSGENAVDVSSYGSNGNQIAVATLLQAWTFQMLTDCYGDIPFSQALKGSENTTPAYDSQADVYAGLITMIDGALASIDAAGAGPEGDIVYGGDMSKWAMFGNSLKLRIAMRMSDVNGAAAKSAGEAALAAGVILDNGDNALFGYLDAVPNNHPINQDYQTRNDFAASNTMVDYLTTNADPRLSVYYAPNAAGAYVGEVYGLNEANAALTPNDDVSQRGSAVLAATMPGIYMDAAQVRFLCAEAAAKGWANAGGSAEEHYAAGIQASMDFWGVEAADAQTYIDAHPFSAESWVYEKWVALYMQGIEGWCEWRRLDGPALNACADGSLGGGTDGDLPPHRFTLPLDEATLNEANWDAAGGATNTLNTPLWWDVN